MKKYVIEMAIGQGFRHVEADTFIEYDGWIIFCRGKTAEGGQKEYWRIRRDHVVGMETKP